MLAAGARVSLAVLAAPASAWVATLAASGSAVAQASPAGTGWPARPIRLIVVYPGGGVTDSVARLLAPLIAESLGQPVVVENKGGANGQIGIAELARSAPDGYTVALAALSPLTVSPHVTRLPYAPLADVAPVASVMYSPVYLLATSAFAGRTLDDVIAQARRQPGAIRVATSGIATVGHLMVEALKRSAGIDLTHVPYKGGAQVLTDAVGGQFELMTANPTAAINAQIGKGTLRVVAVTGPARMAQFPDVPTFAESGHAGSNLTSFFALFGPAGLPSSIVDRINGAVARVLEKPEIRAKLVEVDNLPVVSSPSELAARVRVEHDANAAIVKAAGIRAD
jgi:tripartite-type tricarboxylate transporter receptor subunit TctC